MENLHARHINVTPKDIALVIIDLYPLPLASANGRQSKKTKQKKPSQICSETVF